MAALDGLASLCASCHNLKTRGGAQVTRLSVFVCREGAATQHCCPVVRDPLTARPRSDYQEPRDQLAKYAAAGKGQEAWNQVPVMELHVTQFVVSRVI